MNLTCLIIFNIFTLILTCFNLRVINSINHSKFDSTNNIETIDNKMYLQIKCITNFLELK